MKRSGFLVLLAILIGASPLIVRAQQTQPDASAAASQPDSHEAAKKAALQAATSWFTLIDQGNYDASWDGTSKHFQQSVPEKTWSSKLHETRSPMGRIENRTLQDEAYTTSLPGVPDGEYVVLHYQSNFKNKKSVVETLVVAQENGKWRVAGYHIG